MSTQLCTVIGMGNKYRSSLRAKGWRPSVADWGGGMSAGRSAGLIVRCRGNGLAHAN